MDQNHKIHLDDNKIIPTEDKYEKYEDSWQLLSTMKISIFQGSLVMIDRWILEIPKEEKKQFDISGAIALAQCTLLDACNL